MFACDEYDNAYTIQHAIELKQKVALEYVDASGIYTQRTVLPLQLIDEVSSKPHVAGRRRRQFHLVAFCELRQAVRFFLVHRMDSAMMLDDTFAVEAELEALLERGTDVKSIRIASKQTLFIERNHMPIYKDHVERAREPKITRLSEVVKQLTAILTEHGDMPILIGACYGTTGEILSIDHSVTIDKKNDAVIRKNHRVCIETDVMTG
jgi:hypothetical protein